MKKKKTNKRPIPKKDREYKKKLKEALARPGIREAMRVHGGRYYGNKDLDAPESHSQDVEVKVSQDISIHVKIKG